MDTDLGLKTTLQEVLNLEAEHVVELHLALVEDTDPDQATQQRVALEQPLGVLLLEGEEDPGGGPHLGEAVLDAPHLPLVPQPVLSDQLQLLVQPSLLEGSPRSGVVFRVHHRYSAVNHLDGFKRLLSAR